MQGHSQELYIFQENFQNKLQDIPTLNYLQVLDWFASMDVAPEGL